MKINFTFRQMDSSDALKAHTTTKLERLARFEDHEMVVNATFAMEKYHQSIEFQVKGSHGTFVSHETRDDMYEAIDLAVDKLDRQLAREKSKRKDHKGPASTTTPEQS